MIIWRQTYGKGPHERSPGHESQLAHVRSTLVELNINYIVYEQDVAPW